MTVGICAHPSCGSAASIDIGLKSYCLMHGKRELREAAQRALVVPPKKKKAAAKNKAVVDAGEE